LNKLKKLNNVNKCAFKKFKYSSHFQNCLFNFNNMKNFIFSNKSAIKLASINSFSNVIDLSINIKTNKCSTLILASSKHAIG